MKEDQERTPLRTILQNFLNHIESLEIQRAEDSYEKEFQELKFFSEILKTSKQYSCSEGEKEVNRKKNRYKDILPFDNSRVILSEYAGVPGSDYINANYIKGASGSPAYIACQGPLPHTVNDFWRMVVECEVQVIVMACNEEEAGKHKCENYWVEREGEEKQFGMVAIRLVKASTVCPDFLVRTMRLKYTTSQSPHISEERTVCQFHYSAWPDHGVPPLVRPLLDMVRLVRDTQASETLPVLVHCSAGCGRTGTICAIDYVWGLLRAGKLSKDFSLYKLVQDMRKQRIAMVQTKEQYVLVHQAVRELFREQLRMIDSHPYENIDANGMPLVKEDQEPTYASPISVPLEISNEEKQDGKEKEVEVKIPPLPQKKRLHVASSKQEKEVENLTEKQRSIVEQSSASHKPRIAKLKALFERSPAVRESRSSQAKQRSYPQVARSHSLGAMRIKAESSQEEHLAIAADGSSVRPIPSHAATAVAVSVTVAATSHTPQISAVQTPALIVRPSLPVKRSKSLKVLGSNQRCKLSIAASVNSVTPVSASNDGSDSRAASSTPLENVTMQREEGAANVKPYVPPKKYIARMREISVKDVESDSAKSSKKNVELFKSQKSLDWMSYESSHMVPKRRRSLESVNFENTGIHEGQSSEKCESLDDEAHRILQDCRDYLGNDEKRSVPHDRVPQSGITSDILTIEAQRKVNAIIAGLGVRERRNSFRQAVGTGQESEMKSGRKFKDYEAIWPCGNVIALPGNHGNIQIQESHRPSSYVNVLTDHSPNPSSHHLQSKAKASNWFPKSDERKTAHGPSTSCQMSSSEPEQNVAHYIPTTSSNVRIGKLGIHPKQLSRSKLATPERRLPRSSQTGSEQPSQVPPAQVSNPPSVVQSPPRCETITQTSKPSSLWLRKTKSSAGTGVADLKNHTRQEGSFYSVTEHDFVGPWVGKPTVPSKVQTKEIPYKCSGPVACHRKAPVPNHDHASSSRVGGPAPVQYKPSLPTSSAAPVTVTQMKKPATSQEISYGLVAGVQLRRGSRDDLALCPSPTGGNVMGPHAPSRVRRHASVVLLRRSLAETGGKMNSSLPHSSLTIWNSPTPGNGDKSTVPINNHDQDVNSCDTDAASNGNWLQAPGVDVDTVAASINPQQGDQSTSNLSRALESLHVRKSPHHKSNSMSNIQSTLSNGFINQQLTQPSGTGKKQHYF